MGPCITMITTMINEDDLAMIDNVLAEFSDEVVRSRKMQSWEFFINNKMFELHVRNISEDLEYLDFLNIDWSNTVEFYSITICAGSNQNEDRDQLLLFTNKFQTLFKIIAVSSSG